MMGAESSNLRDLQNDSPYDLSQTTSDGLLKVVICPAKMPEEITKKYEYTTFTYTKELENKEMLQRQIEVTGKRFLFIIIFIFLNLGVFSLLKY